MQRSPQLDSLRVISAYAVIAVHICAHFVTGTPAGSYIWWAGNLFDAALRWCVPFFVMITGALLIPKLQNGLCLSRFFRKRASLLLVFAFWTAAYLAYDGLALLILGAGYGSDIAAKAQTLLHRPAQYHLWYLYMIIALLALAPFLARFASRKLMAMLLIAPAIVWAFQLTGQLPRTPLLLRFLEFGGYFLAGHYLFQHRISSRWALLCLPAGMLIAALTYHHCNVAGGCSFSPYYDYHGPLVMLLSLPLFAASLRLLPARSSRIIERLNPLALGIYLIHPAIIGIAFYVAPAANSTLIMLVILLLLTACLSTFAAWLLHHTALLRRTISL